MKLKFFVAAILAVIVLAFAPTANATVINTVVCAAKNVPPNGAMSCPDLGSAAGYANLALRANSSFDLTYDPFSPPASVTFDMDAPMSAWDLSGVVVTDSSRPVNVSVGPLAISLADYNTFFQGGFSVGVSALLSPSATNGNAAMQWQLTGDLEQVPEPSTWVLLGSALVGLAVYRRRANNHN